MFIIVINLESIDFNVADYNCYDITKKLKIFNFGFGLKTKLIQI